MIDCDLVTFAVCWRPNTLIDLRVDF